MKIGFVGLGSMGSGIARRLIDAGHTLTVYNRTRSRAEPFQALGAGVVDSVHDAAAGAELLITMVGDDRALEKSSFHLETLCRRCPRARCTCP